MKLKTGYILKAVSFVLILSIIISLFSACASGNTAKYRVASVNTVESVFSDAKYHTYDRENSIFVVKSGLIELYFDKITYSVCIKDTAANTVWYSLPAVKTENEQASVLSVKLSDKKGNIYNLNSQDNSVAFDSASFTSVEGGIVVTYNLALDAETAKKKISDLPDGTPAAQINIEFFLADGSFFVNIPDEGMSVPKGINLECVTVLDYMTSSTKVKKDDFIFIPDGSGALIKNALITENAQYSVPVYRTDDGSPACAVIPAFGVKQGDAAYMALVESGDALARINAYTGSSNTVSGRVGVSFDVTEMKYVSGKSSKSTVYSGIRSGDDLKIAYRFLSGNNASYASFSTACREMLIRDSFLSVSGVSRTEYYPVLINIDCAAATDKNGAKTRVLSTFEETEDIISQLKAKGVNNAYVNLKNALSGADEQGDAKDVRLNKALGSNEDYEKLFSYINIQKMKLLLSVNLITSNKGSSGFSSSDRLKDITGKSAVISKSNPFSSISKAQKNSYYALNPEKIESRVSALLRNFRNTELSGYCVNDYDTGLGIDYSSKTAVSKTAEVIKEANSSLATERTLAVSKGNVNSVKSAQLIIGLPSETGYEQNDGYVSVPFAQMVLHGTADYAFEPINTAVDMQRALLKCVEYGALPSFEWFYRETGDELLDESYKYDNSINLAAGIYESVSVLNSLRDCRITGHSGIKDGVYLTEYSDGSLVYVNYNETDVEVNDILIGAKDFVVIG